MVVDRKYQVLPTQADKVFFGFFTSEHIERIKIYFQLLLHFRRQTYQWRDFKLNKTQQILYFKNLLHKQVDYPGLCRSIRFNPFVLQNNTKAPKPYWKSRHKHCVLFQDEKKRKEKTDGRSISSLTRDQRQTRVLCRLVEDRNEDREPAKPPPDESRESQP